MIRPSIARGWSGAIIIIVAPGVVFEVEYARYRFFGEGWPDTPLTQTSGLLGVIDEISYTPAG